MKWILLIIVFGYSVFAEGIQNSNCADITKKLNPKTGQMECPQSIKRIVEKRGGSNDSLPHASGTSGIPRVVGSSGSLLPIGAQDHPRAGRGEADDFLKKEHEINMRAVGSVLDIICKKHSGNKPLTDLGKCPVLDENKAAYRNEVLRYCKVIPKAKKLKGESIQLGEISGSNIGIGDRSCIIGNIKFPDNIEIPNETVFINLSNEVFNVSQSDLVPGIYTPTKDQLDRGIANSKSPGVIQKSSFGSGYNTPLPSRGYSSPGAR